MDPAVLIALIGAVALVANAWFTGRTAIRVAEIGRDMKRLETNTNSKMTELGEALEAKGLAQGRIEGRASERDDRHRETNQP